MPPPKHAIHFSEPLRGVTLAGPVLPARTYSKDEFDAACTAAHERGISETTELFERQMLELRTGVLHLQSRTFAGLAAAHENLAAQFRSLLPELVMEAAARVIAATPISRDVVLRITEEVLRDVEPDENGVEVRLSPHDLELIASHEGAFRERHPTLTFRADPALLPGDCIARSRFGTLDGRISVKLHAVGEALDAA